MRHHRFKLIVLLLFAVIISAGCRFYPPAPPTPTLNIPTLSSRPSSMAPTSAPTADLPHSPDLSSSPVPQTLPPLVMRDPELERIMLDAINQDRRRHGLQPVAWDRTAAYAGALHAADMAEYGYFSHWDRTGHGPAYRYNRVGGLDSVKENVFTYSYNFDDGRPAPIDDFGAVVREAQEQLMQSPGHRANILTPSHTHVGVGFAYNPERGHFYLAQEFVGRYVQVSSLPTEASPEATLTMSGHVLAGAEPLLNLTYQPFPEPMSIEMLNQTGTYIRDVDIYQTLAPQMYDDGQFEAQIPLGNGGKRGLYSVRVWVAVGDARVLASEQLIDVR